MKQEATAEEKQETDRSKKGEDTRKREEVERLYQTDQKTQQTAKEQLHNASRMRSKKRKNITKIIPKFIKWDFLIAAK